MRKIILLMVIILIAASLFPASAARKGTWAFGMSAGLYQPPQPNASWAPLIAARATYWWSPQFENSLSAGYSWYKADLNPKQTGISLKYVPVFLRNTYHFMVNKSLDPYATIGLGYTRTWWSTGFDEGMGALGGVGAAVGLGRGAVDLGVEYVIPDLENIEDGYPQITFGLGLGGII